MIDKNEGIKNTNFISGTTTNSVPIWHLLALSLCCINLCQSNEGSF
jgi:hypothetical protein